MISANVLDMYHGSAREAVPDFAALRINGIYGVVHQVSDGIAFSDKLYAPRREAALAAGVLFGGYHMLSSNDAIDQAKRFLDLAAPDASSLLAVCYQQSTATPSLRQCMDFMQYIDDNAPSPLTCVLYTGTLIRQTLKLNAGGGFQENRMLSVENFFAQHRLWLDEIGPSSNVPWPWSDDTLSYIWKNPFLWKCQPSRINPVVGAVDLAYYPGDVNALSANWPILTAPTPSGL